MSFLRWAGFQFDTGVILTQVKVALKNMNFCIATREESGRSLPGDDIVGYPFIDSTHAISICVPVEEVWPWIVQMGQDRGGFYSYTLLENLIGCRMKNADRIRPEWQHLEEGSSIQIHPSFPPLAVAEIESTSHLVLRQETSFVWTWAFALFSKQGGRSCRLLVRTRMSKVHWSLAMLLYPVMTAGHYLMERKMLSGIKSRCESQSSMP